MWVYKGGGGVDGIHKGGHERVNRGQRSGQLVKIRYIVLYRSVVRDHCFMFMLREEM